MAEIDLSEFIDAAPSCKVARTLGELDEERRSRLAAALEVANVPNARIASVIRDWGYPIGEQTVRRHRVKECPCDN